MKKEKQLSKGIYNWTFLAIAVAAIVIVNVISSLVYRRIDMTEDQRFSLAPGTITYLENKENFKNRLNIKIYLEGNLPAEINRFRNAVEDKLKEFKLYAGDRIEYQFIDPHVGTEEEKQEVYREIFAEGKGVLPMDIVYMKDGTQSQMLLWPGAIIEYGGSTVSSVQFLPGSKVGMPYQLNAIDDVIQNSINNLEYMLISSIRRSTQEVKPRIAFLGGHGELKFQETQRARALIAPYFSIKDVELNDSIHALDDVDGLVIARPTKKFSDKDLYIIDQFLMRGGRLMCFLDKLIINEDSLDAKGEVHTTRNDLGLDKMLFDYGLKINDNYVLDARCAAKQVPFAKQSMIPWFYHVLATPTNHPISRNIEPVSLKYTNEIQFVGNIRQVEGNESQFISSNGKVTLTPILTSSTNSTVTGLAPLVNLAMPLNYGDNPQLVPNPENEANKKCLAGLAEGTFESYFKNRIVAEFANNPDSKFKTESTEEGKVLLIGNGRFLANQYDSTLNRRGDGYMYRPKQLNDLQYSEDMVNLNIRHFFGNQEFVQNLTDYMMGDNSVLDIRSRQIDIHAIDAEKVKADATFYKIINVGLPIMLILILAFVMNFMRKRKYAR